MGSVIYDKSSSLDGFIAGANVGLEAGLGDDGQRLHDWAFEDEAGKEILEREVARLGAVICGCRTYDMSIQYWGDGGPTGEARVPLFVLSHSVPDDVPEGGVYTFVDDLETALARARTLLEPGAERCEQLVHVDAADGRAQRTRAVDNALDRRLDERAEADRVSRRHEVQRPAEQGHPDGAALLQRVRQGLGAERLDPRPQRDVRIARHLRLERDEPLHRLERRHPPTPQEQLALEQGPVQRALRQDPSRGHPVTISTGTDVPVDVEAWSRARSCPR